MTKQLLNKCKSKGIRITVQRKAVLKVIEAAKDHPNVNQLHKRALEFDPQVSIATVYRLVKLLEEQNLIEKHDFGGKLARYEGVKPKHHDHLIDIDTGRVVEFHSQKIEDLQKKIAHKLGFKLCGHRMELYGVSINSDANSDK